MSSPNIAEPVDLAVIIPTFRRVEMLKEAIASALTIRNLRIEVLVIDDDPQGNAQTIVNGFGDARLKYLKPESPSNGRPAILRNWAAGMTQAAAIYFLDDDDRTFGTALEEACQTLKASTKGVLIGGVTPFGDDLTIVEQEVAYFANARRFLKFTQSNWSMLSRLLFANTPIVCSCCMVKREVFLATGGFNEKMAVWEDSDLFMRAIRHSGFVMFSKPILERRMGIGGLSARASSQAVLDAYESLRLRYKEKYGALEFLCLRIWNKALNLLPN